MAPKTREERLFGAACLKVQLERTSGASASASEIYRGALEDLGLTDDDVDAYLADHRAKVTVALRGRGRPTKDN